jgi:L-Lysine epsilon oxidase N-terminal/L-lysine epsilon oxidase C-terminal domain
MAVTREIVACKIHPAIGIARVGNSPEFFIGPEIPGICDVPAGGYKDAGEPGKGIPARVKRQAARFRIFGYDRDGKVVKELTARQATITWTVHLANKKAEWFEFRGSDGEHGKPTAPRRNAEITDRRQLIIDPGSRTITGPAQSALFTGGQFMGIPVPLGEIRTEKNGRLIVLGGFGKSGASDKASRITNYANNDGWFDDTSDGPVTAQVTLKSGRRLTATPSWVIVGPPDFSPATRHFITFYDIAVEAGISRGFMPPPSRISFTRDIYPVFARTLDLQWVQQIALGGHGPDSRGDFTQSFADLANNSEKQRDFRKTVFRILRNPNATGTEAKDQASFGFMPLLSGDDGDKDPGKPGTWLSLTKTRYEMMRRWAEGEFASDWKGEPVPVRKVTPEGLDRAALENCSGGPFFPGIEAGWIMRNASVYAEPFRFDHLQLAAGDITKRNALPWQADFFECREHWWPAQRPDEVLTLVNYNRIKELDEKLAKAVPQSAAFKELQEERDDLWRQRVSWARGLPQESPEGDNAMVNDWSRLGFLVSQTKDGAPLLLNGQPQVVETERDQSFKG